MTRSRTQPSLTPDPARLPRGTPEPEPRDPRTDEQFLDGEDIRLQNSAAVVLARTGYDIEQRGNKRITPEEAAGDPRLRIGRRPDYMIEGNFFDCIAPRAATTPRNIASRILDEKIDMGQAMRFVLVLDRSGRPLEEWSEQFTNHDIDELDEIIVVKGDRVIALFPVG